MKRVLEKIVGLLLLVGILLGLFFVATAAIESWQKAQAENWPSRKAVVTMSSTSLVRGSGIGRVGGASNYWRANVCADYVDTGKRVCVSRVRYGEFAIGRWESAAREAAARYPKGREVDVHYSPQNPNHTVLEARTPWTEMLVLLAVGVGLLLLPALLYVFRKRIDPVRYA